MISLNKALDADHYSIFFREIIIIFQTVNKENITQNLQILNYSLKIYIQSCILQELIE